MKRSFLIAALSALLVAGTLLSFAGEIRLDPVVIDLPAASPNAPNAPNGFRQPKTNGKGELATGGKDVAITRAIVHFDLSQLQGQEIDSAIFTVSETHTQNISQKRDPKAAFPAPIYIESIPEKDYPHSASSDSSYWPAVSSEFSAPARTSEIAVPEGTFIRNTPWSADVTEGVRIALAKHEKSLAVRLRAGITKGDGFIAYFANPSLVISGNKIDSGNAGALLADAKPQALKMQVVPIWKATKVLQLEGGESLSLSIDPQSPIDVAAGNLVLRFRTRLIFPDRIGWNPYLKITLNGTPVNGVDLYSQSRILNRTSSFDGGKYGTYQLASGNAYITFMTPDYTMPEEVVEPEQFQENGWYVLHIADMLKKEGNVLELANTANYRAFPESQSPNDVIVEVCDLELGTYVQEASKAKVTFSEPDYIAAATVEKNGINLSVDNNGMIRFTRNDQSWYLSSKFSRPDSDAFEELGGKNTGNVEKLSDGVKFTVDYPAYTLERTMCFQPSRIVATDRIINKSGQDLGIIIYNTMQMPYVPCRARISGFAYNNSSTRYRRIPENPTLFAAGEKQGIGIFVEDSVFRDQLLAKGTGNTLHFDTETFGIPAGKEYTLEYHVYFVDGYDYFTFINKVRKDIHSDFTIEGPGQFLRNITHAGVYGKPEVLQKRYGKRKIAIGIYDSWFAYYDNAHLTFEQWCEKMRPVAAGVKANMPYEIKQLPAVEIAIISVKKDGDWSQERFADSIVIKKDGSWYNLTGNWYCSDKDNIGYAYGFLEKGSRYFDFMKTMIDTSMDTLGMNGIYFDIFSNVGVHHYGKWDGHSVEIDPKTHKIVIKYGSLPLLEEEAKVELTKSIIAKGGVVVCNQYPPWKGMQGVPLYAFWEITHNGIDLNRGHLHTPIGLSPAMHEKAYPGRALMEAFRLRLMEGGLMYYYVCNLSPEAEGAFEVGEKMYPLTIEELHAGWIKGRERLIIGVPGVYDWDGEKAPEVLIFDGDGVKKEAPETVKANGTGHWKVDLSKMPSDGITIVIGR